MNKKNIKDNSIIFSSISVILFFMYIYGQKEKKRLRENHVITQAKIVEYLPGAHNGGAFIDYTFNYENVIHESSIGAKNDWRKLIGMEFPLIFEKNKPENNQILILSEHFEEFEFAFPDSLKWTEKLKR